MSDSAAGSYQFLITDGAKEYMIKCGEQDPRAAAYLASLLMELRGRPADLDRFVDEHHSDDKIESISAVWSLQHKRINAYRAKFVEIRNWRLIFIVDRLSLRIGLFAIMNRGDGYENNQPLWADIEREFDALGFTKY